MTISPPTHRRVPRDAGGRFDGRRHGAPDLRASGRGPESSPLRLPAARVHGWSGDAMMRVRRSAARGLPRVQRGGVLRRGSSSAPAGWPTSAASDRPVRADQRRHTAAGVTIAAAAIGAIGGAVVLTWVASAPRDGRRATAGLLAAAGSLAPSHLAGTHVWRGPSNAEGPRPRGVDHAAHRCSRAEPSRWHACASGARSPLAGVGVRGQVTQTASHGARELRGSGSGTPARERRHAVERATATPRRCSPRRQSSDSSAEGLRWRASTACESHDREPRAVAHASGTRPAPVPALRRHRQRGSRRVPGSRSRPRRRA